MVVLSPSSWGVGFSFSQWSRRLKMGSGLGTWQEILILDFFFFPIVWIEQLLI